MNEEIDFVIDVVCDHAGAGVSAAPETVCRVGHREPPAGRWTLGFLEWVELAGGDWHRAFEDFRHLEKFEKQGMADYRFNFRCRTCGDTLPVKLGWFVRFLDALREHGVQTVTLTAIRAREKPSTPRSEPSGRWCYAVGPDGVTATQLPDAPTA